MASGLPLSLATPPPLLANTGAGNVSGFQPSDALNPSVAIDPTDPNRLAAVWVVDETTVPNSNPKTFVTGAISTDAGASWTSFRSLGLRVPSSVFDFKLSSPGNVVFFPNVTDASVAFDRNHNFFVLSSAHEADNSAGELDLERFDFKGATPNQATFTDNGAKTQVRQVYKWENDPASTPTLAVDSNLASFNDTGSDGTTRTQSDPFSGNVYVAWQATITPANDFNNIPFTQIRMVSSSDQGQSFSHPGVFNRPSTSANDVTPRLAISQGRPAGTDGPGDAGVPGGQVTAVWDNYDTFPGRPNSDLDPDTILSQVNDYGGTGSHWDGPAAAIRDAIKPASGDDIPQSTTSTVYVDITDPKFLALQNIDVSLTLSDPNLGQLSATLTAPDGEVVTLFRNNINPNGSVNANVGLSGANLGIDATSGTRLGTVFDDATPRGIRAGAAPYIGRYRPEGASFAQMIRRLTADGQVDGAWTLTVTVYQNQNVTTPPFPAIVGWALDLSSGMRPGLDPQGNRLSPSTVAGRGSSVVIDGTPFRAPTTVSGDAAFPTATAAQKNPILPAPVIASDNTLGAYSRHQGRLYVAYTGRYSSAFNPQLPNNPADNTDIFLVASDDGGRSWSAAAGAANGGSTTTVVNRDNALTDGFSEGAPGTTSGRPKFDPQVAVDQSTGALVVSYFDTRNDASRARVATYVGVSNDGGTSFGSEAYANPSSTAVDAITGRTVNLGPLPDNQSAGNKFADATFGYGDHQGLAVAAGRIIPVWASNQNLPNSGFIGNTQPLTIVSALLTTAAGPRVIDSTMGPAGEPGDAINAARNPDGSPAANSFAVTFDRPIDPATFQGDYTADGARSPIGTGDVRVYFQDPYGPTTISNPTPSPTVLRGTFTSTLAASAAPGTPIVDGRLTLSLSNFIDLGNVTVQLVAPNGRAFNVPTAAGTRSLAGTFALPADVVGGALNGNYRLKITDNNAGATIPGTLDSWSVQLNGVPIGLRVLDVRPIPNLTDPLDSGALGYDRFLVTFDPTDPSNGVRTGVGTYSYLIRPTLNDRIRTVGAPFVGAGTAGFTPAAGPGAGSTAPAPRSQGLVASAIAVSGHPFQSLVDNTAGAFTATVGAYPSGNVGATVSASISVGQITTITPPSMSPPPANVANLQVYLATPDGQRYLLSGGVASASSWRRP